MRHPVILHICLSKGWGGLEMYPIRMGKQFLSAGYQVFGLCLTGTQVESGMQETQFSLYTARSKSQLTTVKLYALIQWVKQHQINVIHCHKSGDLLIAALIKQFVPVKIIFTEHMGVTRSKKISSTVGSTNRLIRYYLSVMKHTEEISMRFPSHLRK